MASSKRAPSVLVTDSRERPPTRISPQRASASAATASSSSRMRFISVDNVLQYSSDIPSGQPRGPPSATRSARTPTVRRGSHGGGSMGGGLGGGSGGGGGGLGGLPTLASTRTGQQNVPSRTTKVSEKLVLLPEAPGDGDGEDETDGLLGDDELARRARSAQEENRPLNNEELDVLRKRGGIRGKSFAERLPKKQRADKGFSRVTAYCTAQAYRMKATAEFVRTKHEAKTKLYDDCLYVVYHMPLLPGIEGCRVRSRPILKTPGTGKTLLDLEIERSERRDEHEGFLEDVTTYAVQDVDGHGPDANEPPRLIPVAKPPQEHGHDDPSRHSAEPPASPLNRLVPDVKHFAEMFVFSYGVVVFWNFTERQEKDILADMTFAGSNAGGSTVGGNPGGSTSKSEVGSPHLGRRSAAGSGSVCATGTGPSSPVTRPLNAGDFETEEFHFEYSADVKRPRVFNDMITLLPRSDHMVKLTISHAIAQSTKLSFFEERMSETMLDAQYVPKRLALTGELNMTRTEIVKILGRLFKSRVDINLSSNILDVPNFFWDSEPTLHPLYVAIREYLEIDPRIKVLNERCRVFLDLAEILSDSVADAKMSAITWIIIILIVVSIFVTSGELLLRWGLLEKGKASRGVSLGNNTSTLHSSTGLTAALPVIAYSAGAAALDGATGRGDSPGQEQKAIGLDDLVKEGGRLSEANITIEDLRLWAQALSEREKTAICGARYIGKTFAGV